MHILEHPWSDTAHQLPFEGGPEDALWLELDAGILGTHDDGGPVCQIMTHIPILVAASASKYRVHTFVVPASKRLKQEDREPRAAGTTQ